MLLLLLLQLQVVNFLCNQRILTMALVVRHFISTKAYVMPAAATDVLLGISRRVTAAEHRHHPQHVQCTRFKSTTTNQSSGMATKLLETGT